jgi:3-deoxy-7-phosphoheptulonate synthase
LILYSGNVQKLSDLRVRSSISLPSPESLRKEIDKTKLQREFIAKSRDEIHRVLTREDKRLLVIVGPCSIHDVELGKEYARKIKNLSKELEDRMLILMRVYFEKPRTTVGWKGLIMDPYLNGSCDIPEGLKIARKFLDEVTAMGIPAATEFVDPITPQYISDFVSWAAIGARTTESQTHRQMASGLSMPVGFKNSTEGNLTPAINAILAATQSQTFLGIGPDGMASAVTTDGNPDCHAILRGGIHGPNYQKKEVDETVLRLAEKKVSTAVMVDCSHDNSSKDIRKYGEVLDEVLNQVAGGNDSIIGVMIESNLNEGSQSLAEDRKLLKTGISITDPCIGWEETEQVLRKAYQRLACRF